MKRSLIFIAILFWSVSIVNAQTIRLSFRIDTASTTWKPIVPVGTTAGGSQTNGYELINDGAGTLDFTLQRSPNGPDTAAFSSNASRFFQIKSGESFIIQQARVDTIWIKTESSTAIVRTAKW